MTGLLTIALWMAALCYVVQQQYPAVAVFIVVFGGCAAFILAERHEQSNKG